MNVTACIASVHATCDDIVRPQGVTRELLCRMPAKRGTEGTNENTSLYVQL